MFPDRGRGDQVPIGLQLLKHLLPDLPGVNQNARLRRLAQTLPFRLGVRLHVLHRHLLVVLHHFRVADVARRHVRAVLQRVVYGEVEHVGPVGEGVEGEGLLGYLAFDPLEHQTAEGVVVDQGHLLSRLVEDFDSGAVEV